MPGRELCGDRGVDLRFKLGDVEIRRRDAQFLHLLRQRRDTVVGGESDPDVGQSDLVTTYSAALNTGANGTTPIPAGPPANLWSARYAEVSCLPDTKGNIYFNTPTNLCQPGPGRTPAPGQMMPVSLTPLGANGTGPG